MKLDLYRVYSIINSNKDLRYYYNWYVNHCTSLTLPYHNIRHTLGMMYHIICLFDECVNSDDYEFTLTENDLYVLLVSALFHDYNHSGGRFSDDVNVYNAKCGLRDCISSYLGSNDNVECVIRACEDAIDGTQYPYVISDDNLSVHQRILRECDILVCLYDDYFTHRIYGLMEEMRLKESHKMFLAKEAQFIFDAVKNFKLSYSINTWNKNSDEFMNFLELMTKVID